MEALLFSPRLKESAGVDLDHLCGSAR
jgi:hypothetical protein